MASSFHHKLDLLKVNARKFSHRECLKWSFELMAIVESVERQEDLAAVNFHHNHHQ
jgi:hypothetical protein